MKKTYYNIMTFISHIFNKRKLYYSSRYCYYRTLLDKYRDGQFYCNLINNLKIINEIKTNTEIRPIDNKKLNETVLKDIIRKYGKPNYKIIYENLFEIKVLFYKQKLGKYKTKLGFHFFKNNLFFYTYTFSHLNPKDKNEIVQIIKEKYLEGKSQDIINKYIVDKNRNIILLNDNMEFSIYYLCANNIILEKILEYIDLIRTKEKNKEERYKKILYKRL